jgi:hypothetical protein
MTVECEGSEIPKRRFRRKTASGFEMCLLEELKQGQIFQIMYEGEDGAWMVAVSDPYKNEDDIWTIKYFYEPVSKVE